MVKEVTNALRVYDEIDKYNPLSLDDLKLAHKDLMEGLVDNPGDLRSSGVGIQRDEQIIHVAPPAANVPYSTYRINN